MGVDDSTRYRSPSRWGGRAWWLGGASLLAACLSDVRVPDCVEHGLDCQPRAGAAGEANSTVPSGAAGAPGAAGSEDPGLGGARQAGGDGSAGGAEGGWGGAGAEPCSECIFEMPELRQPCAGQPYSVTLRISGGVAPYRWRIRSGPSGWFVREEPSSVEVTVGSDEVTSREVELELEVTDANGHVARERYHLPVRSACWFAYTALGAGGPELFLQDPWLHGDERAPLEFNSGVYDFRFSPDGRFLAYRFDADGLHPRGRRVALVHLSTRQERALNLSGSEHVEAYAWAPTSDVLAVAYTVAGTSQLGGVRVPADAEQDLTDLVPLATPVGSELQWVGGEWLIYHAATPDQPSGQRQIYYSKLGAAGFGMPDSPSFGFYPPTSLLPASDGFFAISPEPPAIFVPLYGVGTHSPVDHALNTFFAPSGRYSMDEASEPPELFTAHGGWLGSRLAPSNPSETCPLKLAWAAGEERFACVIDVANEAAAGSHGEVRFFDVSASGDRLSMSTLGGFCEDDVTSTSLAACARQATHYAYGEAQASGTARGFSPSGRHFAFVRITPETTHVYWSDLDTYPRSLGGVAAFLNTGEAASPTALAFSPDERRLLVQRGTVLSLVSLGSSALPSLADDLVPAEPCSEQFPAGPDTFCGTPGASASFVWGATGREFAYRHGATVTVADVSQAPWLYNQRLAAPRCEGRCLERIAFQPPIQP